MGRVSSQWTYGVVYEKQSRKHSQLECFWSAKPLLFDSNEQKQEDWLVYWILPVTWIKIWEIVLLNSSRKRSCLLCQQPVLQSIKAILGSQYHGKGSLKDILIYSLD
jgi:hypothetical protein